MAVQKIVQGIFYFKTASRKIVNTILKIMAKIMGIQMT